MSTHLGPALRYCGRDCTPADLERIRRIPDDAHQPTRAEIARAVCAALGWNKPDGQPKVMSCRVATHGGPRRHLAHEQLSRSIVTVQERFPKVADMLAEAEPDILAHMDFPAAHWRQIRSTNSLERLK